MAGVGPPGRTDGVLATTAVPAAGGGGGGGDGGRGEKTFEWGGVDGGECGWRGSLTAARVKEAAETRPHVGGPLWERGSGEKQRAGRGQRRLPHTLSSQVSHT